LPFGAAQRLDRGATERIEYVCGRHDTDEPIAIEHRQGANQALSHEVGRLADRRLWRGASHVSRHHILDPATLARGRARSAAEIAFGEHADEPLGVHDHQVANAAAAQPSPSFACSFFWSNGYNPGAHYFAKLHPIAIDTRRCG
jgi:hypothetical protein